MWVRYLTFLRYLRRVRYPSGEVRYLSSEISHSLRYLSRMRYMYLTHLFPLGYLTPSHPAEIRLGDISPS